MGYCCRLLKWEIKVMIMKGKGETVLEYINQRNGELLLNMIHDFGLLYVYNKRSSLFEYVCPIYS